MDALQAGCIVEYDICLSFAVEDRAYVNDVAAALRKRGVKVFYDAYERAELWGKDLYTHLDEIYRRRARYCVIFVSEHYARKLWTNHERQSAQARAFAESAEYVLPARFDDTEIPGLRPTIGYIDLRVDSKSEFVDIICKKLGRSWTSSAIPSERREFGWASTAELDVDGRTAAIHRFQSVPIRHDAEPLGDVVSALTRRIRDSHRRDGDRVFWSHFADRHFDRLYATSSVLTALCQLGVDHSDLVSGGIRYLRETDPGSIDDRAATIFRLVIGDLSRDELDSFLAVLEKVQISSGNPATDGAFLLPQGPSSQWALENSYWTSAQMHSDGASFHACHIADALLHIPAHLHEARGRAEPILERIRTFLVRSFETHDGWLVNLRGKPTPLTLFAYALCPALRIPLPAEWRSSAEDCFKMVSIPALSIGIRFFGVMNALYASRSIGDEEFTVKAAEFAKRQFSRLPSHEDLDALESRDWAAILRGVAYGVELIDPGLGDPIRARVRTIINEYRGNEGLAGGAV